MAEWKRIFKNRIWLGVLAALLLLHGAVYLYTQAAQCGGSLTQYAEETRAWEETLSALSLEEGQERLEEASLSLLGWSCARFYVQTGGDADGEEADALLEHYRETYPGFDDMVAAVRAGTAPTDQSAATYAVEQWQERVDYLIHYESRIETVVEQAQRIRSSTLFSSPGSFEYRSAEQTEQDYLSTADVSLTLTADDGIVSLAEDQTAAVFGLCLMAATVVLLLEPRRLGLETAERSAANGRCVLTLWRIGALLLAAAAAALLLEGSTLLLGIAAYQELPDLSLPVQTIPYFQHWTAEITVGGFLLWYGAMLTAGLFLSGLLFWLLLSRIPSLPLGLVLTGGGLLLEYHWFTAYGINDAGYALASVNLFHLLSLGTLAERYLNYDLFGYPVREKTLLAVIVIAGSLLCAAVLLLSAHFRRRQRQSRLRGLLQAAAERLRSRRGVRSLLGYEARKALLYSGGALLLCAAALFLWTREAPALNQSQQALLLTQYVRTYAGELSEGTEAELLTLSDEAAQELAEAETGEDSFRLEYLTARSAALTELASRYSDLLSRAQAGETGLQLVDETPLEQLYGETGETLRQAEACLVLLAVSLLLPGLFAIEEKNGMRRTLLSAPRGRDVLWRSKLTLALGFGAVLWLLWTGRELWLLEECGLRWDALAASGASLSYWNDALGSLPLGVFLAGRWLLRLVGLLAACGGMLWVSARVPALLAAGGLGAAALILPELLAALGAQPLRAVSWAHALAGDSLALIGTDAVWALVWCAAGLGGALASRAEWNRTA